MSAMTITVSLPRSAGQWCLAPKIACAVRTVIHCKLDLFFFCDRGIPANTWLMSEA